MKCLLSAAFLLASFFSFSQKLPSVQIIQDSIISSFRGLSVPSDNVIWVSGSNGTVGRSTDAGKTWKWMIIPGFEKRDFRDIEAFDSLTAIIMAVDNPGNILKTTDGGKNWKVVFHKEQEGMFLDAMEFIAGGGYCIGDPVQYKDSVKKQFYLLTTRDSGDTWIEDRRAPFSLYDEAIFAASGTNFWQLVAPDYAFRRYAFITGGAQSRLHIFVDDMRYNDRKVNSRIIPIVQGKSSTGAFSMTTDRNHRFYIAGGDYVEYWKDSGNVIYTSKRGKWNRSSVHGYRSCIIQTGKKTFITCGTNGVDISFNGCKTFQLIHGDGAKGKDGFNVCAKSKTGKAVYFAGTGRIGKLIP
jgi:photosystem II stability/assembly factor-like uncharacterized protein